MLPTRFGNVPFNRNNTCLSSSSVSVLGPRPRLEQRELPGVLDANVVTVDALVHLLLLRGGLRDRGDEALHLRKDAVEMANDKCLATL